MFEADSGVEGLPDSIESYKMLKFNTFQFYTDKVGFPLLILLQSVQCVAIMRLSSLIIFHCVCIYMEI